jgi:hypothetical protein
MKQYFLMLSWANPDVEEALCKVCQNIFRINFSTSAVYFFYAEEKLNEEVRSTILESENVVLMDITESEDFIIKMDKDGESEALEELFQFLKKENANNIDGVLDKISKYGRDSLTKHELKILKSL